MPQVNIINYWDHSSIMKILEYLMVRYDNRWGVGFLLRNLLSVNIIVFDRITVEISTSATAIKIISAQI
jgi:hypothetical protein